MRTLLVGECTPDHLFRIVDPTAPTEAEFEYSVVKALSCAYADYQCIMFSGTFVLEERGCRPDLALVARDLSHWFIIEVELVAHSLEGHVLPQVRRFRYGEPQDDCVSILARELKLQPRQAATFLRYVPRGVAVVANKRDARWEIALRGVDVQLIALSVFGSPSGVVAFDIDGVLQVTEESLGFGQYSATDRSIRFARTLRLPDGELQIDDPSGAASTWTVARTAEAAWVTKKVGQPDLPHESYVLLAKAYNGRIFLKRP